VQRSPIRKNSRVSAFFEIAVHNPQKNSPPITRRIFLAIQSGIMHFTQLLNWPPTNNNGNGWFFNAVW
ncbi:MAG: hypothetical protein ACREDP_03180, partial [Bradyrhizobium sp.]